MKNNSYWLKFIIYYIYSKLAGNNYLPRIRGLINMKKYYTIYEIDKETNDIVNTWESEKREEVANWLDIRLDNFSKYVAKNIDNITCKLKNDKYFVMIEKES